MNDSARAMMAAASKYRDDMGGSIATGGTSTAFTLTSYQVFTALQAGLYVTFNPHTTCGAAPTINVDGLGAKPLRSAPATELGAGVVIQGTPYEAAYFTSNGGEWIVFGYFANAFNVPIGMMSPYLGSTAPNSSFALPYGQAISRTTYASLFALTSTAFGVGDGVTTFNIPDLRGRLPVGLDNMGGSAASRVTTAGSSIDGTTVGATGGAQNVTMAQGNLPNVNFTVTDPGHTHPLHFNGPAASVASGAFAYSFGGSPPVFSSAQATSLGTTDSGTTGISVASGGSGTAVNKMPPAIILPYILRVI